MSQNISIIKSFDILNQDETSEDDEFLGIDAIKFRKYIETNLAIGHKQNGKLTYHLLPFVQCKKSDF